MIKIHVETQFDNMKSQWFASSHADYGKQQLSCLLQGFGFSTAERGRCGHAQVHHLDMNQIITKVAETSTVCAVCHLDSNCNLFGGPLMPLLDPFHTTTHPNDCVSAGSRRSDSFYAQSSTADP